MVGIVLIFWMASDFVRIIEVAIQFLSCEIGHNWEKGKGGGGEFQKMPVDEVGGLI